MKTKILSLALLTASLQAYAALPQEGSAARDDGYTLVWQELFDKGELDPARWNIEVNGNGGGNQELQYYTDSEANVRVADDGQGNGCLILTARREAYKGKNFTSGRVNSLGLFAFKHGKVEAAIRLPKTDAGLWPAFWMMGSDYAEVGWPRCGETDILEMGHGNGIKNGVADRFFNGACHWGKGWPNASYAKDATRTYSLQDGEFHLYTLIWDENEMAMYCDLDRKPVQSPYFKMSIPADEPDNEWSPGNYFHKENFIIFNLAIGGNFPGIHDAAGITALNDANGNEASMYVNYVKVYQKGTDDESIFMLTPSDDLSGVALAEASSDISVDGYSAKAPGAYISVYNLSGLEVAAGEDSADLSSLPSGMYIVRAVRNGSTQTIKTHIHR